MLYAASKSKTGKNTKNNKSGVNLKSSINEKNDMCDIGTNKSQTKTNSTVYGKLIFLLAKYVKLQIISKVSTDKVCDKKLDASIFLK